MFPTLSTPWLFEIQGLIQDKHSTDEIDHVYMDDTTGSVLINTKYTNENSCHFLSVRIMHTLHSSSTLVKTGFELICGIGNGRVFLAFPFLTSSPTASESKEDSFDPATVIFLASLVGVCGYLH